MGRQLSREELVELARQKELQVCGMRDALIDRIASRCVTLSSEDLGLTPEKPKRETPWQMKCWSQCVQQVRIELNITGFLGTKKGTLFYTRVQQCYQELLAAGCTSRE